MRSLLSREASVQPLPGDTFTGADAIVAGMQVGIVNDGGISAIFSGGFHNIPMGLFRSAF